MNFKIKCFCVLLLIFAVGVCPFPQVNVFAQEQGSSKEKETEQVDTKFQKMVEKARSYTSRKKYDQAIEEYQKLMRSYPNDPYLMIETGEVYCMKKDFPPAEKLFNKAVSLKPDDTDIRLAWPRALENYAHDRPRAISVLKTMISKDPQFTAAKIELAQYYSWDREWDQSLEIYNQILAEDPDNVDVLYQKAEVLWYSGQPKEAIPILEKIIELNPMNLEAQETLGQIYMETRNWQKAEAIYENLYKLKPNDSKVMKALADAYFFDERYDAAKKLYGSAAAANPQLISYVSSQLDTISAYYAPTLSYSFLYYVERDRSGADEGITDRVKTEEIYNTIEFTYPLNRKFELIGSFGTRHDDIIHATAERYGVGWRYRITKNLQHYIKLEWEPRAVHDQNVEPRWFLNNIITYRATDRVTINLFHYFNTYWDGNISNTQGFGISRYFFKEYDVLGGYRFTVDTATRASDYYVIIKRTGANLKAVTNRIFVEKYWNFTDKCVVTTGTAYDVTDQGRNIITVYGNMSYQLTPRILLIGGTSWFQDNWDIQAITASGYISYRF